MLLQELVICLAEGKTQVGKRLELVGLYDGEGSICPANPCVENRQEFGLGAHSHGLRGTCCIVYHVLLAERKKFYQVVRKSLEVDM